MQNIDEYIAAHTTNPNITTPTGPRQVLVFGSNLKGIHGAGAAKTAYDHWHAIHRQGYGWLNRRGLTLYPKEATCWAVPTKDDPYGSQVPLYKIAEAAQHLFNDAYAEYWNRDPTTGIKEHDPAQFLVTAVGCGRAGYTPEQIAPLFAHLASLPNVWLPAEFWAVIRPHLRITEISYFPPEMQVAHDIEPS